MILLTSFIRGCERKTKGENGEIITIVDRIEYIKCYLYFKNGQALDQFIKDHSPHPIPTNPIGKPIETKWPPFYTKTAKELGIKEKQ